MKESTGKRVLGLYWIPFVLGLGSACTYLFFLSARWGDIEIGLIITLVLGVSIGLLAAVQAVFAAADTAMIARSAKNPRTPKRWSRNMILARTGCVGEPSIVALPDSSAGVLYASSKGGVYFVRVQEAVD